MRNSIFSHTQNVSVDPLSPISNRRLTLLRSQKRKEEKQSLDFFFLLGTSDRSQERRRPLLFGTWVGSLGGVSPPAPEEISSSPHPTGFGGAVRRLKERKEEGGALGVMSGGVGIRKGKKRDTLACMLHVTA